MTATPTQTGTTAPDVEKGCTSCFSPNVAPYFYGDGAWLNLCPLCSRRYALWNMAHAQLLAQVREVARAWLGTWGTVPGIHTLSEALAQIGDELDEEFSVGEAELTGLSEDVKA